MLIIDYLVLGYVIALGYITLLNKYYKKKDKKEIFLVFLIVWLFYPIVLLYEFTNLFIEYFVYKDK